MNAKQLRKQLYKLDEIALTQLVVAYRLPLIAFVCTDLHDEFTAEDIVSEVFVRLLVKEPKLRDATALKTYLFSVAKNMSIDYLRKRKREKAWLMECEKTAGGKTGWFIENALIQSEEEKELFDAVERLPRGYRETLYLHYFEEMSIEEIAKTMGKTKKQIYNLLARAKKLLSEKLEKGGVWLNEN